MYIKGKRCSHGLVICSRCVSGNDPAAQRMSGIINALIVFTPPDVLMHEPWMAFRLSDGSSDGTLYPDKATAIRFCSDERLYCFFYLPSALGGASPKDCELWLDMHRHAYDQGMRLSDPGAPDLIPPLARGTGPWPM